jgi:FMN reductase
MIVVSISGSPSLSSRSAWLLEHVVERAGERIERHQTIAVRELPAQALIGTDAADPSIAEAHRALAQAQAVLIGTPIYKAAYSGLLKLFLDGLPSDALRGKPVLALATGGSPGHLLALDYALRPVLSALGARTIVDAVYAIDSQLARSEWGGFRIEDLGLVERLDQALDRAGGRRRRPTPQRSPCACTVDDSAHRLSPRFAIEPLPPARPRAGREGFCRQ